MASDTDDMLPRTPGPKLGKFKNGNHAPVQFVNGLGSGAHSHVWRVTIDGETYALKMFRHIRAEEENAASAEKLEAFGIGPQLLNDQLTPFNCEARAYGRLRETGSEDIAWRCYGYIALGEETYASAVWDRIGLPRRGWFSQYIATDAEVADRPVFPIYALVKEFIPDASRLGALDISKAHDMAQGINKLHSIGITHRDIQDRNYKDSRIMDFSTAWTVPNIRLDRALKWDLKHQIDEADTNDYFMFDDMIEKWNLEHPAMPPSDYRMTRGDKYRPVTKTGGGRGGEGGKAASVRKLSASSSGSSVELEEIPLLERMRDNRYLVLASSYDWVGRRPAVAQPDVLAPPRPLAPRQSWAPLGFSVPEFPIAGFPLPGSPAPEPDTDNDDDTRSPTPVPPPGNETGPSTTEQATVPGPSTLLGAPTPTPGPGDNSPAGPGSRPPPRRSREARKLEAIREAAGGISSACDTLKAMAENIVHIIDDDDEDDDDDGGGDGGNDTSPGTRQQQEAARRSGRAARPGRRRRREEDEDEDDEDGAGNSSRPPARRVRREHFDGSLARRLMSLSVAGQPDTVERR